MRDRAAWRPSQFETELYEVVRGEPEGAHRRTKPAGAHDTSDKVALSHITRPTEIIALTNLALLSVIGEYTETYREANGLIQVVKPRLIEPPVEVAHCPRCGKWKTLDEFYGIETKDAYCIPCRKEYKKEWRKR